ncbi:MAG: InlB B-repeat-containing protein [Clostridia bacterium]|nr:InlB B-repeat-containing protein [Clostridia bacterium]
MTLYAGWVSNEYEVRYYYSDVNSKKNAIGSSPVESITVGNKLVAAEKYNEVLTRTLIFDKVYTPQYLNRIGYTFLGWTFGFDSKNVVANDSLVTYPADTPICLNKNAIEIKDLYDTAYYMECLLYIDKEYETVGKTNANYNNLGRFETLGDTVDAAYTNTSELGITYSKTTHHVQMLALWDVNTYTVEFNVNQNYNFDNFGNNVNKLLEDSTIANYAYQLYSINSSNKNTIVPTLFDRNNLKTTTALVGMLSDFDEYKNNPLAGESELLINLIQNRYDDLVNKMTPEEKERFKNATQEEIMEYFYFEKYSYVYQYDNISLSFNRNQLTGFNFRNENFEYGNDEDYRFIAYVTFDTNDWYFITKDGTKIDEVLYYMIVQKFGYYFGGWYANNTCKDDDVILEYFEEDINESTNMATGYYLDETLITLDYSLYTNYFEHSVNENPKAGNSSYDIKYGFVTTGNWIENRQTRVFELTLYAKWVNKEYEVTLFDPRGTEIYGSTTPYFSVGGSEFNEEYTSFDKALNGEDLSIKVRVLFDSTNWYAVEGEGINVSNYKTAINGEGITKINDYLYNILIDRYGYTWTGWFGNDTLVTTVLTGHTSDKKEYNGYTENCVTQALNYRTINTYTGLSNYQRTLTLYAGWDANIYYVSFDLADVNSGYGISMGSSVAYTTEGQVEVTEHLYIFDTEYSPINLHRNGYTFVGWIFGRPFDYMSDYEPHIIANSAKFVLNKYSTLEGGVHIYKDENNEFSEELGDYDSADIGDMYRHYSICYAIWEQITYTVEFYGNKMEGSTNPYFMGLNDNTYKYEEPYRTIKVRFDDNYWFDSVNESDLTKTLLENGNYKYLHYNDVTAEYDLDNILVDRYGYRWLGWYLSPVQFIDDYKIISGNSFDDRTMTKFVDSLFAFVFSQTGFESNTDNTIIRLYAGWEANTYSIIYNFSDNGTIIYPYGEDTANGREIDYELYKNILGSTTAVASEISSIDNISTIVFDTNDLTKYLQLTRTGYIFNGWRMNTVNAKLQENYNTATTNIINFLTLDSEYASDTTNIKSCQTEDSFLYYFPGNDFSTTHERLGDSETENEHVIILYADWTARTYEIVFDMNNNYTLNTKLGYAQTIENSTYAEHIDVEGYDRNKVSVRVVFDTNNWFGVIDGINEQVNHILSLVTASRIGYTFLGWYTTNNMYMGEDTNITSLIYQVGNPSSSEARFDITKFVRDENLKTGFLTETEKHDVTGNVTLYAGWQQITYTAIINPRDVYDTINGVGTSPAWLTGYSNTSYSLTLGDFNDYYEIRVKFDSQEYNIYEDLNNNGTYTLIENYDFYEILIDRYGYTWTGWYFDKAAKDSQLVGGHTANDIPEFGTIKYLTKFDITIYWIAHNIAENEGRDMDEDLKYNVYSGWNANSYRITYDLNDKEGINNFEDLARIYSSKATLSDDVLNFITFDYEKLHFGYATRPGYTFAGWCLYYEVTQQKDEPCTFPGFDWKNPDDYKLKVTYDDIIYEYGNPSYHKNPDRMMIYQSYVHDKDPRTVSEVLGDLENESQRHIVFVAKWVARIYNVELDYNDLTNANGSTEADVVKGQTDKLKVQFDSDDWYRDLGNNNKDKYYLRDKLLVDRYGYTFKGWSTRRYTNGNTPNSDYIIFDRYLYDEENDIQGKLFKLNALNIESSLLNCPEASDPEAELTVIIYAIWEQNEYSISMKYNDNKQKEQNPYDPFNIYFENPANDLKKFAMKCGSSNSNVYETTFKVKFDDSEGINLVPLDRHGYDFYGFTFGTFNLSDDFSIDNNVIFKYVDSNVNIKLNATTIAAESVATKNYLYGKYNKSTISEKFGDEEGTNHFVSLYALWTPIEYTVTLDVNDGDGSTTAYYFDTKENEYVVTNINDTYTVKVVFDTNEWNYITGYTNDPSGPLSNIKIARIGYDWTGWFTKDDGVVTNSNNCSIIYDAKKNNGLTTLEDKIYNTFSIINDDTKKITLYAGWKAKTYTININYNENIDSTSLAYFMSLDDGKYNLRQNDLDNDPNRYKVEIVFDTSSWKNINNIIMDRFGFTWLGLAAGTRDKSTLIRDGSASTKLANSYPALNRELFKEINDIMDKDEYVILNENLDTTNLLMVYAKWKANTYKVNISLYDELGTFYNSEYKIDGHGSTTAEGFTDQYTKEITLGKTLQINSDITRKGYKFIGWIVGLSPLDPKFDKYESKDEFIIKNYNNLLTYKYLFETGAGNINLYNTEANGNIVAETYGDLDKDRVHNIYVYAYYKPIEYTITLVRNDKADGNGTTDAYFKVGNSAEAKYNVSKIEESVMKFTITFDTNEWINMNQISIDRYGYNFNGWYTTKTKSDDFKPGSKADLIQIIPALLGDFEKSLVLDERVYDHLGDSVIDNHETSEHKITIYAGWKAKIYNIVYMLDAGGVNITTILKDSKEVDEFKISHKQFEFDKEYTADEIKRNGYDFVGWSFSNYTADPDVNNGFIECNTMVIPAGNKFKFGLVDSKDAESEKTYNNVRKNKIKDQLNNIYLFKASEIPYAVENDFKYITVGDYNADILDGVIKFKQYGDDTGIDYVFLYPVWKPKTYTIHFFMNDSTSYNEKVDGTGTKTTNGSTKAQFSTDYKVNYYEPADGFYKTTMQITMGASYIEKTYGHISTDRYGYTFKGWYYSRACDETVVYDGKTVNMKFSQPASLDENKKRFEIPVIEYLIASGQLDAESETLILYAGWSANIYYIDYVINAIDGSSSISKVVPNPDNPREFYKCSSVTETITITFDQEYSFEYMRIGYSYLGYAFKNYAFIDYQLLERQYNKGKVKFDWSQVHDIGENGKLRNVFLYSSTIDSNDVTDVRDYNACGQPEVFGDKEFDHYVVLYLGWQAMEYKISISLNTIKQDALTNELVGIENYNKSDSGYYAIFDNTHMLSLSSNALRIDYSKDYPLIFTLKFDDTFANAKIVDTTFGKSYKLSDLNIVLTGYTFKTLNTHFDTNSPSNVIIANEQIVSTRMILDSSVFYKLYYQTHTTLAGNISSITNKSFTEIYTEKLLTNSDKNYSGLITYTNEYTKQEFTLFAGYEKNKFDVNILSNSDSEAKGLYNLVTSKGVQTIGFNQTARQTTTAFLGEHITSIPENAGSYLSRMVLKSSYTVYVPGKNYLYETETRIFTLIINYKFNSSTRLIEIDSYQVEKEGPSYKTIQELNAALSLEAGKKVNVLDYVMNDLTSDSFTSFPYITDNKISSQKIYSLYFPADKLSKDYSYDNAQNHVNITNLFIDGLKSKLSIECEYEYQKFNLGVYFSISDSEQISINVFNDNFWQLKDYQVKYGEQLIKYINQYNNKYPELKPIGWYTFDVTRDTSTGKINGYVDDSLIQIPEEEINNSNQTIITKDIYLCYALSSNSADFPTIKVSFFTWNGNENGSYSNYVGNDKYLLQSKTFYYEIEKDENGQDIKVLKHAKIGYVYDEKAKKWDWTDDYKNGDIFTNIIKDDIKLSVVSGQLKKLPNIATTYPNTESICYVLLDHQKEKNEQTGALEYVILKKINARITEYNKTAEVPESAVNYASDLKDKKVYIRILDITDKTVKRDGKDIIEKYAKIEFVGEGALNGLVIENVPVLTQDTLIDTSITAYQAYSSFNFTLDKDYVKYEGNKVLINEKEFNVTYFETDGGSDYKFYSSTHGDLLKYVILNRIEYESFVQSLSKTSSIPTALIDTIDSYGIKSEEIKNLEETEKVVIDEVTYYAVDLLEDEYLFVFYYKRGSTSTIVTVCDKFATIEDGALSLYSTSNNLSFTQDTISTDITFNIITNKNETLVRINKNRMNVNYTDKNGVVYNNSTMYFAILSNHALRLYFENFASLNSKEKALMAVINAYRSDPSKYKVTLNAENGKYSLLVTNTLGIITYLAITSDVSIILTESAYIMAYYSDVNTPNCENIVKLATNYAYINTKDYASTSSIIYIEELLFTEETANKDNSQLFNDNYTFHVKVDTMFTTTYDFASGKTYNYGTDKFGIIVLTGSLFREYSDAVVDGFMTRAEAITSIIAKYPSDIKVMYEPTSNKLYSIEGLEYQEKYYVLSFYYTESGGKVIKVVSTNNLMLNNVKSTGFDTSVMTLSNNFSFTTSSVNLLKEYLTVTINDNHVNKVYEDYSNANDKNNKLEEEDIRYLALSKDEYNTFVSYYKNGVNIEVVDGSTNEDGTLVNKTYTGLSMELALEMVIYYYRGFLNNNDKVYANLFNKLAKEADYTTEDLSKELDQTILDEPSFAVGAFSVPQISNGGSSTHYLLSVGIIEGMKSVRFNKVTSNLVKVNYESNKFGETTKFEYEIVEFSSDVKKA